MGPDAKNRQERRASPLRALAAQLDYHAPSRRDWALAWRGRERPSVQAFLLECARAALREATTGDALVIYKAAYAVQPLRGAPLIELAMLLAERAPVPLEWCDALVAALEETETPDRQRILGALTDAAAHGGGCNRTAWIRRCLGRITE